jgi:hypothetical protein
MLQMGVYDAGFCGDNVRSEAALVRLWPGPLLGSTHLPRSVGAQFQDPTELTELTVQRIEDLGHRNKAGEF